MQPRTNFLNEVYHAFDTPEDFKGELRDYIEGVRDEMNKRILCWEMWDLYVFDLFTAELTLVVCTQEETYYGRRFAIKIKSESDKRSRQP